MLDIISVIIAGGIVIYLTYKEGLKRGAEKAIDELENTGFIDVDKHTGEIKPVRWEYVYPDRSKNVNTPED